MVIDYIQMSVTLIISLFVALIILSYANKKIQKRAVEEARSAVKDFCNNLVENQEIDIIKLMHKNVSELQEYYVISKQHARESFIATLITCFIGLILYALGIISYVFLDKNINVITVISGTAVEVISGLFLSLYKNTIKQLEIYHRRLESTERYLIVYHMIMEVSEEHRYEEQRNYINYVLNDNQHQMKNE